jgi:hypothetical protein
LAARRSRHGRLYILYFAAKEVFLATTKYSRSYGCLFGATLSAKAVNADVAASKAVNASDSDFGHIDHTATISEIPCSAYTSADRETSHLLAEDAL